MSKKSIKSAVSAKVARRKADIAMVNAIGSQVNTALSTVCEAVVLSRRSDFEGLESKDRAAVLMAEGTTLQAVIESSNALIANMTQTMGPTVAQFLTGMVQVETTRAAARATEAQAELLNAQSRQQEAEVKGTNAETERVKAETSKIRYETALESARERAREREREAKAHVNGVDSNEVW